MSRILVIDDDRSVRHLITKAFEDTDVEVVPAATADEGMHLLGEAQSDVVLLDILLAGNVRSRAVRAHSHGRSPSCP